MEVQPTDTHEQPVWVKALCWGILLVGVCSIGLLGFRQWNIRASARNDSSASAAYRVEPTPSSTSTPAPWAGSASQDRPSVDEQLFLSYAVEDVLERWPSNATDAQLLPLSAELRALSDYIVSSKQPLELRTMVETALSLPASYSSYLAELYSIDSALRQRETAERIDSVKTGLDVAEKLHKLSGSTDEERSNFWPLLVGGVTGLVDDDNNSKARSADKQRLVTAANARWNARVKAAYEALRQQARALGHNKGWAERECPFGQAILADLIEQREHDPFVSVRYAAIRPEDESPEAVMSDARRCVAALSNVPDGTRYDGYRARFLSTAGQLAALATSREWFEVTDYQRPTPSSQEAVAICKKRLEYPGATDRDRYNLAKALNFKGLHKEALKVASECTQLFNDPGFAYDLACLLSLNGDTAQSLSWLGRALANGHTGVNWARRDPDLRRLRRLEADAFDSLTKVEFSWQIEWGVLNDDIALTNKSAFALTNVVLRPSIMLDDRVWSPTLSVERLSPGEVYRWTNAISVPGSRYDEATASLSCDQK